MVDTARPKTEDPLQHSEFARLYNHLCDLEIDNWDTTFGEIETILGSELPPQAKTNVGWWWNRAQTHMTPQAKAWRTAGWVAFNTDLDHQTVSFRRQNPIHRDSEPKPKIKLFEEWDRRPYDFGPWPEGLEINRHNGTMGYE